MATLILDEPKKTKFDPDGSDYDYDTAIESGDKPDETGHWSSIDPRTGMILKGKNHETFYKTIEAEEKLGNRIVKRADGRYYSVPKDSKPTLILDEPANDIQRNPKKTLVEKLEPVLTGMAELEDIFPATSRQKMKDMFDLQPQPAKYKQRLIAEMLLSDKIGLPQDQVSINFDTVTKEYFGHIKSDADVIAELSPYKRLPEFKANDVGWFTRAFNTTRNYITKKTGMFAPDQSPHQYDPESGKYYRERGPIGKIMTGDVPLPDITDFMRKNVVEAAKHGASQAGVRMVHSIAGQAELAGDVTRIKSLAEWGKVMAQAADLYYQEHPEEMMQLAHNRGLLGTTWQYISRPELIVQGTAESVPMLLEAYLGHITGTKAASMLGKGTKVMPWAGRVIAIGNQSFGDTYSDARAEGTPPAAALPQAILTGSIEGAIEEFTLGKKVKVFENAAGQTARRGIAKLAADAAIGTMKAYGRGSAEEFTQQLNQNFWQMVFTDKQPLFDDFSRRLFDGSLEAGASGGLLEISMTGGFAASGKMVNFINDKEKLAKIKDIRGLVEKLPNLSKEHKAELNTELDKVSADVLAGKFKRGVPAGEVTAKFTEQLKKNFNIDDKQARAGIVLVEAAAAKKGLTTDEFIAKNIAGIVSGNEQKQTADVFFQEEPFKIDEAADAILEQAKNAGIANKENTGQIYALAIALADMAGSDTIKAEHIAEAIQYTDPKWIKEIITPKTVEFGGKGNKQTRITGGPGSGTYERMKAVYEKAGIDMPDKISQTPIKKDSSTTKQDTKPRTENIEAKTGQSQQQQGTGHLDLAIEAEKQKVLPGIRKNVNDYLMPTELKRQIEPVQITGEELGQFEHIDDLRKKARQWASNNIIGKTVQIKSTGENIQIPRKGVMKATSKPSVDNIKTVIAIPQLIENSVKISSEADKKNRAEIKAIHKYAARLQIGETIHDITIVIRETMDGAKYYDHYIDKKLMPDSSGVAALQPLGSQPMPGTNDNSIGNNLSEVKKKTPTQPTQPTQTLKPSVKKASVEFLEDGRALIKAFENADFSSFVHEIAHIFRRTLESDLLKEAENFCGVKDNKWTVEAEEKFARAFEKYLYEGKAPNQNLKALFAKFREWLRQIYTSLKGSSIDITISDDIKRVFDKMLTSGGEIHPGEMTFDDFFAKLGKELEKSQSMWIEKYALGAHETPNQMHKRLIKEWKAQQTVENKKSAKNEKKLSESQKKQIEQLEAEAAAASQSIINAEKEKTIGELLEESNADELILDEFKNRLQEAYIAGTQAGIDKQRDKYKGIKQKVMARKVIREHIKQLGRKIAKPAPASCDVYHREAIAMLQAGIDPSFRSEKTLEDKEKLRKFIEKYPDRDMPPKILDIISRKALNEYTISELEKLAEERKRLEDNGKKKKELLKAQNDRRIEDIINKITNNIKLKTKKQDAKYQVDKIDPKDIRIEEILNQDGEKTGKIRIYYKDAEYSKEIELEKGQSIERFRETFKIWLETGNENVINAVTAQKPFTRELRNNILAYILTPSRIFDMLDGGEAKFDGIAHKTFYDSVNDADAAKKIIIKERLKAGKEKLASIGISPDELAQIRYISGFPFYTEELAGIYGLNKNDKARIALSFGNKLSMRIIADVVHHCEVEDPRLAKLADWLISEYEQNFDRLENAYIDAEDTRLTKEANYLPMVRKDTVLTDETLEQQLRYELQLKHSIKRAYAEKGFTISRQDIEPELQKEIRLDIWTMWPQQVERQEHYIHFAELVRDLHRIEANPYLQDAIREKSGDILNKKIKDYVSQKGNPYIFRTHGFWGHLSSVLRSNLAMAYLGFNVATSAKQLVSILYYLPDAGVYYTMSSLMEFVQKPLQMIKFVREFDPLTDQSRAIDTTLEDIKRQYAGQNESYLIEKWLGNLLGMNAGRQAADVAQKMVKAKNKIGQIGLKPIEFFDTITRTIGWNAVYQKALAENKSQAEAVRLARNATLRTQNAAASQDLPAIYNAGEGAKWVTMFSNQANKTLNMLIYDLPKQATSGQKLKATLGFLGISIGALLLWSITNRRLPEDDDDLLDVAKMQGLDILPSGRLFTSNFGSGIPLADEARKIVRGVENEDPAQILDAVATLYGLPTVGTKRVYRMFDKGSPMELIGKKKK